VLDEGYAGRTERDRSARVRLTRARRSHRGGRGRLPSGAPIRDRRTRARAGPLTRRANRPSLRGHPPVSRPGTRDHGSSVQPVPELGWSARRVRKRTRQSTTTCGRQDPTLNSTAQLRPSWILGSGPTASTHAQAVRGRRWKRVLSAYPSVVRIRES